MYETPLTALVLSGGGARAAYQVGVLRALARMRRSALGPVARLRNPFGVICGTSAGAINAVRWPARPTASKPRWKCWPRSGTSSSADQVYRADSLGVIRRRAVADHALGGLGHRPLAPCAAPFAAGQHALADLLQRLVPLERLP
jgi:NTE family protein